MKKINNIFCVLVVFSLVGVGCKKISSTVSMQKSNQNQMVQQKIQQTVTTIATTDKDFDGLNDNEETTKYDTNQNNPDTDGDGLLDGDEIKIYQTDPTKADTYAIGHNDGWGVAHKVISPGGKVNRDLLKTIK